MTDSGSAPVRRDAQRPLERLGYSRWIPFLIAWSAALFVALVTATFLHEVGHGLGARIDGVSISTGFNRVGNPGLRPDDPGFRTDMPESVLADAGGPFLTLLLAITLTAWLLRFRRLDAWALAAAALAVSNAVLRLLPMGMAAAVAAGGRLPREDEVMVGLRLFGDSPLLWLPAVVSATVSATCCWLAFRHLIRLAEPPWWTRVLVVAAPVLLLPLLLPLLDWLDRVARINW